MIRVSLGERGFMFLDTTGDQMASRRFEVPQSWGVVPGLEWMREVPLQINPEGNKVVVTHAQASDPLEIEVQDENSALVLAQELTQLWMQANGFASVNVPMDAVPKSPGRPVSAEVATTPKISKTMLIGSVLAVLLVVGGFMGAREWTKPKNETPTLDLSAMDTQSIAQIDSNPAAIDKIGEELLAAMNVGRLKAGKSAEKMESEHVEALKALGLEPGPSMKNAMACLGGLQ